MSNEDARKHCEQHHWQQEGRDRCENSSRRVSGGKQVYRVHPSPEAPQTEHHWRCGILSILHGTTPDRRSDSPVWCRNPDDFPRLQRGGIITFSHTSVFRVDKAMRISALTRTLQHPWRILGIVLGVVFAVEVGVMLALPHILPRPMDHSVSAVIDATLLTIICAPVLWWIIIGPLRRIAIAEQRRSETIVANAGDGIMTTDLNGTVLSANRAAAEVFQCATPHLVGRPLSTLVPGIDLGLASGAPPAPCEAVRCGGSVFPAALTISQLPSEDGIRFVVIVRDLTESRRIEEQRMMAAREKEALRAQQMTTLAQLATGVAHEIRNPLTSVKMLIQTNRAQLQQNGLPTEDLELVEQEIRRMERSVNALLEYARPVAAERRPVPIRTVIDRMKTLVDGRAQAQGVRIVVTDDSQDRCVIADPEQLQQLFLNLSLNALDAMPDGGTLQIRVRSGHEGVNVSVADTGTGINPAILKQLFTPFVTSKKHGVGLGLGICRRIAEDHGGQLTGENRPEGGAEFLLSLPAATSRCPPEETL